MRLIIISLIAILAAGCVDSSPTKPARFRKPTCEISATQDATMTIARVTGDCPSQGMLWGGGATRDNKSVFYIGNEDLRRRVSCPFYFVIRFATPSTGVDWKYVVSLEAEGIPGVTPCRVVEKSLP